MKNRNLLITITFFSCCSLFISCKEKNTVVASTYKYIAPVYSDLKLLTQRDSLRFLLSENTYNEIKSFNYFTDKGTAFISFYDGRSASINIYDFATQQRVKKIKIKKWLRKQTLYKTSVFVKNFDSIFIANQTTLYLFDSEGKPRQSIEFIDRIDQLALFDNAQPPVLHADTLYMGVRPWVQETNFSALRQWKLLYGFNLRDSTKKLFYSLPEIYQKNIYGYQFLNYSYCYNDRNHFVFSFPADTNIYETNLIDYHVAYYGKSRFQTGTIQPVQEEAIKNDKAAKEFRLRDSYGPIYYDAFHKRYLRLARQKFTEEEYSSKSPIKKQSLIIFNEKFEIISESKIEEDFSFSSLFITTEGNLYARVNSKDEYALNFVRLSYSDSSKTSLLTKK